LPCSAARLYLLYWDRMALNLHYISGTCQAELRITTVPVKIASVLA
jgi:hypothetical protein